MAQKPASANRTGRLPEPRPGEVRRQPLPWDHPKSAEEDPSAPESVRQIIESPGYREADRDLDFLARSDTRGVRLQLDYMKAELLLEQQGVRHTIVVFGSTRIPDPRTAQHQLDACAASAASAPGDASAQRRLAIARRVLSNSRFYEEARRLGQLIGAVGDQAIGGRIMVMTGGGPGIMEAANRGAYDLGKDSIGLNIALAQEQYPNPYVTPELCFSFHYFAMRKLHFLLRARALVIFPGGYGTMDELFDVLALVQTRKMKPLPIILVGPSFWRNAFNPDFLLEEGVIDVEDRELFWFAETAEEIWHDILSWHEKAGQPLLPPAAVQANSGTEAGI